MYTCFAAAIELKPPRIFRSCSAEHVVCCVFPSAHFFAAAVLNDRVFVHEFDNNMVADVRRGSVCSMDMIVNGWCRRRLRSGINTGVSPNLVCAVATPFLYG